MGVVFTVTNKVLPMKICLTQAETFTDEVMI